MSFGFGFALPAILRGLAGYDPFNQTGPTLDLSFAGAVTDLSDPNGYTLTTDFIVPQYQIAAQYSIWENGMGLVSKTFSQIITFTRASSATYFDSAGVLQTATTDAPRFDYDPSTLAAQGLLIEEARTNLHLYSQDFSTGWATTGGGDVALTAAAANGLDGTLSAASLLCATTTDTQRRLYASANITVSSTGTYSYSCYVKPVNGWQWISVAVTGGATVTTGIGGGTFDLTNGTLGTTTQTASGASGVTKAIYPAGNGWYKVVVYGTMDGSTTNLRPKICLLDADESYAAAAVGVVGAGVYVWGAQLEAGAFPTSYIPTVASTVTRAVDVAQVNTLSPWFNASEGTLYAEGTPVNVTTTQPILFRFDDGSNNNTIVTSLGTSQQFNSRSGGVSSASIDLGTPAAGAIGKVAGAYKASDFAGAYNGTAADETSGTEVVPTVTLARLGATNTNTANVWVRRVTYYPRRLSNAELQAITS